ncbi:MULTISPECIES: hypothetical protein [unclassified Microbacterium]|uniref:hypothetical protein n=1 Tax=unclassified Microbacterium TaxID=2609290 RepID=UPI00214C6D37|nr:MULTISPECIES: hypothetical protein [unclassified Microbacterium]MCR2808409.1 hypothetical protein [Microbacterium sp. zg.B185]WIM19145.1 hypothetical protein QNO12_16445 [Microbacterium sp. zg-B185]
MKQQDLTDVLTLIEGYHDRGQTDGLPIVPPERHLVDVMVAFTGRSPDEVIGVMPPRYTELTVRDAATNAVMAGCLPEHLPVVLAALEVILQPDFNPMGVATSTKGVAPLIIVNGPIRGRLALNARGNLFGPGPRANAAIGRAVRLAMLNVGGAKPRVLDKTTIGHPGKYSQAIAEDEEGSHWDPLHVTRGYKAEDDVVTVIAVEAAAQILTQWPTRPETVLDTLIESLNVASHYTSGGPTECLLIFAPEHRAIFQKADWSRQRVAEYIQENCWRTAGDLWQLERDARGFRQGDPLESKVYLFGSPDDLTIVAAGGPGVTSTFCWGFADHRLLGHSGHRLIQPPAHESREGFLESLAGI